MSRSWSEYKGLKVVIIGAATGMGAATCQLLVDGGADVYAFDVKPVEIKGIKQSQICNLLDQQSIDEAIAAAGDNIDCLFYCAGLGTGFSWANTLTVNFFAMRYVIENLLPKMNKGGAIATIASLMLGWEQQVAMLSEILATKTIEEGREWAEKNTERWADPYHLSKITMAAWVTFEAPRIMQDFGVRLNTLGPGVTESPMLSTFQASSGETLKKQPNPIGRYSAPEEQAQAMMFLNSPLASYLVGALIHNDGGLCAALLGGALKARLNG